MIEKPEKIEFYILKRIGDKKQKVGKVSYRYDNKAKKEYVECKYIKSKWKKSEIQLPHFSSWEDISAFLENRSKVQENLLVEYIKTPMAPEKRMYYMLQFLKKESDKNHPKSQKDIMNYFAKRFPNENAKLKSYHTTKTMIKTLALAMNTDEGEHIKPYEEWGIVYDEFFQDYAAGDDDKHINDSVNNIYFQSAFSYEELDKVIEAIRFSSTIDREDEKNLVDKIKKNLASKYYENNIDVNSFKVIDGVTYSDIQKKMRIIQEAMSKNVMIRFQNCYHNKDKKLEGGEIWEMSPYDFLAYRDHYYIYGEVNDGFENWLQSVRIDLIDKVKILSAQPAKKKEECYSAKNWTKEKVIGLYGNV